MSGAALGGGPDSPGPARTPGPGRPGRPACSALWCVSFAGGEQGEPKWGGRGGAREGGQRGGGDARARGEKKGGRPRARAPRHSHLPPAVPAPCVPWHAVVAWVGWWWPGLLTRRAARAAFPTHAPREGMAFGWLPPSPTTAIAPRSTSPPDKKTFFCFTRAPSMMNGFNRRNTHTPHFSLLRHISGAHSRAGGGERKRERERAGCSLSLSPSSPPPPLACTQPFFFMFLFACLFLSPSPRVPPTLSPHSTRAQ